MSDRLSQGTRLGLLGCHLRHLHHPVVMVREPRSIQKIEYNANRYIANPPFRPYCSNLMNHYYKAWWYDVKRFLQILLK